MRVSVRLALVAGTEPWNKWLHPDVSESWVEVKLMEPTVIVAYAVCSANDYPERAQWHGR